MTRQITLIFATLLAFLAPAAVFADLDPELAEVGSKNEGGLFLGAGLKFGQTYATGGSNPGLAYLASIEPGYVATRDSWGRIEVSLELSTGKLAYTKTGDKKAKVDLPIGAMVLARLGYGWSFGQSMFGLIRVGAGPVLATYKASSGGVTERSDGAISGLAGQIGYDLVVPMNEVLDIVGGFEFTHVALEVDDVKSGGKTTSYDEPINLNIPLLAIGVRFKF